MNISLYAKLAAGFVIAVALAAFGWSMYHKGDVAGQAFVQDKWDKQTAQIETQTAVAVAAAASDALANYHQAGTSVAVAKQHKADIAGFQKTIIQRVNEYAESRRSNTDSETQSGSAGTSPDSAGGHSVLAGCGLDSVGLRIWNDANTGIGGVSVGASGSAPGSDATVSGSAIGNVGRSSGPTQ